EATRDLELSAFVLYSSAAATLGGIGLGAHGAASAFLDALAAYRRGLGLPATSVAWGAWANPGHPAAEADAQRDRLRRSGVLMLTPERAFAALRRILDDGETYALVADVDWARFARAFGLAGRPRLLDEIDLDEIDGVRRPPDAPAASADRTGSAEPAALTARLAGLGESEAVAELTAFVRARAAAVLGHPGPDAIPADQRFLESGFDSLTAIHLRNRINSETGLRLPSGVIFAKRTPAELARHLHDELRAGGLLASGASGASGADGVSGVSGVSGAGASGANGTSGAGGLGALLRQASADGRAGEFLELLMRAARFRPLIRPGDPLEGAVPRPVVLADGGGLPALVCLPSVLATAGAQQYARLAACFSGSRNVLVLEPPGFSETERLPATLDVATTILAAAAGDYLGGAPFVLAGYSSGGLLAHALARRLESAGVSPEAVVLLDAYPPEQLTAIPSGLLEGMIARADEHLPLTDARLTAMGGYLDLLAGWRPEPVRAPTLLVRATRPLPGDQTGAGDRAWAGDRAEAGRGFGWDIEPAVAEVPADHFTLMEDQASATARVVGDWLSTARPRTELSDRPELSDRSGR
ncbi:MAG: KR domain-containing protein, partial [Nocardiopsaceae bacterium]|nr:KR domain-containing protein [Nocardiopsaceae bacterium]